MKKLIIGGDSFTLGSELTGKSWAELLGDKLNYQNINVSDVGFGNASICRTVLNAISLSECSVVVMWAFLARFDHYVEGKWKTTNPNSTTAFDKIFYKHVGDNELYELHNTLTNVLLLQNTLEKYNIPYFFTSADKDWTKLYFTKDPWIAKLISLINWDKWYSIDNGNGFYDWGKKNYPCGKFGHPLDQAHIDLCENIFPFASNLIGFAN